MMSFPFFTAWMRAKESEIPEREAVLRMMEGGEGERAAAIREIEARRIELRQSMKLFQAPAPLRAFVFAPADLHNLTALLQEEMFGVRKEGTLLSCAPSSLAELESAYPESARRGRTADSPAGLHRIMRRELDRLQIRAAERAGDGELAELLRDRAASAGRRDREALSAEGQAIVRARFRSSGLLPFAAACFIRERAERMVRLAAGGRRLGMRAQDLQEKIHMMMGS